MIRAIATYSDGSSRSFDTVERSELASFMRGARKRDPEAKIVVMQRRRARHGLWIN